jgi:hypothetical protein
MNQEFWNIYKEIDASFKKEKEKENEYKKDIEKTNINETKLVDKIQTKEKEFDLNGFIQFLVNEIENSSTIAIVRAKSLWCVS